VGAWLASDSYGSVMPLGPAFTPEEVAVLCDAFDAAWDFVQRFSDATYPERSVVRQGLARDIIMSARLGETHKVALANFAIRRFRASLLERQQVGSVRGAPGGHPARV
jgi:hypothetical protein